MQTVRRPECRFNPRDGNDLALPIQEASRSFSKDDNDKFLVLLSDGEDLEGQGLQEAKNCSQTGNPHLHHSALVLKRVPLFQPTLLDQAPKNFLTDRQGKKVLTKLDEDALRDIAVLTGGQYLPIGPTGEGLIYVFDQNFNPWTKKKREQLSTELPINRYQVCSFAWSSPS